MKRNIPHRSFVLAVGLLLAAGVATADSDLWLHVKVDEAGGANVVVNLPISLVEKALPMIPVDEWNDGHIHFDGDVDWTLSDFRELWFEVRDAPDMTFVTVKDRGDDVRVWKEDGYLRVRVLEDDGRDAEVNVQIPARVVDALLSGDDNQVNVRAAIEALVDEGEGELVTVNDSDDRVRVWVDRIAEAE